MEQADVAIAPVLDLVKAKMLRRMEKLERQRLRRDSVQVPFSRAPRKTGSASHWVSRAGVQWM